MNTGSAPSSGGRTAANQLSPHHNYTTEQISPTYSHDNHSVPQPQRVTPNFPVSPIPPAALQGNFDQRQQTVRQTSDVSISTIRCGYCGYCYIFHCDKMWVLCKCTVLLYILLL